MSWFFTTVGNDADDPATAHDTYIPEVNYCGVVLLFMGGRVRAPLVIKDCPFNYCGFKHDICWDLVTDNDYEDCNQQFKSDCDKVSSDMGSIGLHRYGDALYQIVCAWTAMRINLARFYLNWK